MKEFPVMKINACSRKDLPANTPVWNRDMIESKIHVFLDPYIVNDYSLYKLEELTDSGLEEIPLGDLAQQSRNWLDINTDTLNVSAGQHSYRVTFFNMKDKSTISLYFSYILQDSNPDRPYVYMNQKTSCCTGCQFNK